MPRSSKAPEPPPEPDYNEIIQNDVAKIKRLLGLDINRLAIGSEIEGIVENSPFGAADYTVQGVNLIEFVNVSTSIGPAQGGSGAPAQVTGLTVTPQAGSNTQLNLAWTANTAPDFNYYNVYRGTSPGFTVGPSSEIAQPTANAYSNTGLSQGTTYYYRVSTTNDALLEGATSSEVSGTTTTPGVPAQVTGLTVTPQAGSDTQLNLAWNADIAPDFNFYNVYRSTTSGFTPASGNRINQPVTNSYNNTGLSVATTYYYRVSSTNDSAIEGPPSAEVPGITTGDVTAPGQVTGLAATVISDTQINLTWTASAAGDLNHYDVHRSTTSGFTPSSGNKIASPTTNSYNNTGLVASTTYYYKVAAVDNASNIGAYSAQVSATTQTPVSGTQPEVLLHFDNNYNDSSGNNHTVFITGEENGFITPAAFGAAGWKCNYPQTPPTIPEYGVISLLDDPTLRLNSPAGFSFSIWVYPVTFGAAPDRKWLVAKCDDANNEFTVQIEPSTLVVQFHVKKAGTSYKRQTAAGLTVNAWNHVAGTFNNTSNTIAVYKDAVAGVASTAATDYDNNTLSILHIGDKNNGPATLGLRLQGYVDEFQYFTAAVLTPAEVTSLFNTNEATSSPDTTPPAQTVGLTASAVSTSQINLGWTASTATDLDHYDVHRATTSGFTPAVGNRIAQPTTNSYNNTGLTASTTYYYKVAAVDDSANIGAYSAQVTATTPAAADTTPPAQTVGLTATAASQSQINLAWTASTATDLNHYDVHRATTSGFTPSSANRIVQPTTNSYSNTGLTASTTYYYRVGAVDNAGNIGTYSAQVTGTTSADTTPPGQVTGLTATAASTTQINLGWTASSATDLNHYDVHRATTTGFTPAVGNRIAQPTTNSYNNTGLTASTTYYYKVAAVDNAANIGTYSAQVTGTTQAAAALDTFGIKMLNPTATGGRVWNSNWHTATSHSWSPASQEPGNEDPQDSMADLICPSFCKAVVDAATDTMTCSSNTSPTKASFRLYIKDPACTPSSSPWKWSPSTEITIYYKCLSQMDTGTIHVHCRLIGPSEHWNAITDENPTGCKTAGHDYAFEVRDSGSILLRKEEAHLETSPDGYAIDVLSATNAAPYNTWIGLKLVTQKQGANMLVQGWRDTTDGASGGTWTKMVEIIDNGTNWKLDPASVAPFNALSSGSGNCAKINPIDRALTMTASACGLRADNQNVQYKKFSIREINSI